MTEQEKIKFKQRNDRRLMEFIREFRPFVQRVLSRHFRQAASLIRQGKGNQVRTMDFTAGMGVELMKLYTLCGTFYARQTLRSIERQAREEKAIGFGLNQEWIDMIKEYFRLYLLNKAVLPIAETTLDNILAIMEKGYQEGWGVDRIAFEIEKEGLRESRARTIVRTEILKARYYGDKLGEAESEWETTKEWGAVEDDRTRDSHRKVDGMKIDSDDKFAVPRRKGGYDMMDGPGDPEASAENVINCRCRVMYRPKRDKNGRLIKKRKISVFLPEEIRRTRRQVVTV